MGTPREFFEEWTHEQLVDEVLRLEALLVRQASRAECAWCHQSMPIAEATDHVRTCTYRPQSGSASA